MAFLNINPAPMMLPGFSRVVVQSREPFIRMVTPRAVPKNEDLAIATVTPLPEAEVPFHEIRDVVLGLLVEDYGLQIRDIQMCPFGRGQAYVRFARISGRDGIVAHSPHHHLGFNVSFAKHNRGDNAKRVNFNRECWLMLIGYPPDYRSNEEIGDTIKSFGRLLFWQRDNVLARIIIKARVTDLIDIPHYIIISEGDFFEGVSLTVQCEILQQDLLGGMPQDEDIPPGGLDDNFIFPGIGLGGFQNQQQLNWPLWPQGQHVNPENVEEQIPDQVQQHQADVNEQPADAVEGDLIQNQMVVDEQPPNPDQQALDQGEDNAQINQSVQVGSSVFSSSEISGTLLPDLNLAAPAEDDDFQFPEVLLPTNHAQPELQPQDFLEPEIQPDELMNEEEIVAQIAEEQNLHVNVMLQRPATNFHLNLNVGLVRLLDRPIMDPMLPFRFQSNPQPNKLNADVYRLWAKKISPVGKPDMVVQIPKSWASFF
jgi:hypothetical protein